MIESLDTMEAVNRFLSSGSDAKVIEFWATWCKPCTMLKPEVELVAEELKGIVSFGAVEIDQLKEAALEYEVPGAPTLVVFREGKEIDRIMGYKKAPIIQKLLKEIIG